MDTLCTVCRKAGSGACFIWNKYAAYCNWYWNGGVDLFNNLNSSSHKLSIQHGSQCCTAYTVYTLSYTALVYGTARSWCNWGAWTSSWMQLVSSSWSGHNWEAAAEVDTVRSWNGHNREQLGLAMRDLVGCEKFVKKDLRLQHTESCSIEATSQPRGWL